MTSPTAHVPKPIFDNLSVIRDELRQIRTISGPSVNLDFDIVDEYIWALKFLVSYDGSSATFNSYRRELERVYQWSWLVKKQSVLTLSRDEIIEFIDFVISPPVAWIGTKNVARFLDSDGLRVANDQWHPFVMSVSKAEKSAAKSIDKKQFSPSQSAIQATFAVLSSFYDYLIQESVVPANPVALIRQKSKFLRKHSNQAPVRRVSNLQWDYVMETAEIMADENPGAHERTLFIMAALFAMYLRISELVADERSNPTMGDFRKDRDGNWWFHVTGKGNKDRTVTVSNAMLKALKRYREFRGQSPLPTLNEKAPLIPKIRGAGPVTSTRMIRIVVQKCFDQSYERMKKDGLEEDAQELKEATVHWLRHTGISEDIQTRPREHVRDDAGHASMATTDRYIESDLRERHASGKKKRIKDF